MNNDNDNDEWTMTDEKWQSMKPIKQIISDWL